MIFFIIKLGILSLQIHRYIFLFRYTLSAGRFTIQDPEEKEDAGEYQCIVENSLGKILSNPAKIVFGCKLKFYFLPKSCIVVILKRSFFPV